MRKFDIDTQRSLICVAGLLGLFFQLLAYSIFGIAPFREFIGIFGTMAAGPIGLSTLEKFSSRRAGEPGEPDPPPPPPPSDNQPPTREDPSSLPSAQPKRPPAEIDYLIADPCFP